MKNGDNDERRTGMATIITSCVKRDMGVAISLLFSLSLNSLGLLLFSSANYIKKLCELQNLKWVFIGKFRRPMKMSRDTPIPGVISKSSKIDSTSNKVLLMMSGIGLVSPDISCMASGGVEQLFYCILLADVVNIDIENDHTFSDTFPRDVWEMQELNIHLSSPDVLNHDVGITRLDRHIFVGVEDGPLFNDAFADAYFYIGRAPISYND
uniref:Uncharacterized protein n=1 Tax=Cucumis melo TaxID=3656 RepID=A0A9I9DCY8_CUCME